MDLPAATGERARVLLVDDSPANLLALSAALESVDADLMEADSGTKALRYLLDSDFAAIILDIKMPTMDGFETAAMIRSRKRSESTPILFMTGYRDDEYLCRAYNLGAVDFLFKPVSPEVLRAKVRVFIELHRKARVLERLADEVRQLNVNLEAEVEKRTQELSGAKLAAEAANREKSRFLASMSHELRTPLNAVIGYSEMLEEEAQTRGASDFVPDLQKIRRAANHLLGLINNVLDMSRIEAGRMTVAPETFDLGSMIQDVTSTAEPLIRKNGNQFEWRGATKNVTMFSDQTKVRQCLLNLLSNAGKFTKDGVVKLNIEPRGESIRFQVSDSGAGIPEDQMERLFQPFTQFHSDQEQSGSGLGLAITRRLAELLGGEISVQSKTGTGSLFTLDLPLHLPESEPSPNEALMAGAATE